MLKLYLISLSIFLLDILTKNYIQNKIMYGEQVEITSFLSFVHFQNPGAAFSFLSDESGWQRWLFSGISICASVLIIYLLKKHFLEKLFCVSLSLILGGALGNLWDRISLGYVVDFLDFHYGGYHWPAFNVADSAICVGALLLILESFKHKEK